MRVKMAARLAGRGLIVAAVMQYITKIVNYFA